MYEMGEFKKTLLQEKMNQISHLAEMIMQNTFKLCYSPDSGVNLPAAIANGAAFDIKLLANQMSGLLRN